MKNRFQIILFAVAVIAGLSILTGCGEEDPAVADIDPPTNFAVFVDCGVISLAWTLSDYEYDADFAGYAVFRGAIPLDGIEIAELLADYLVANLALGTDSYDDAVSNGAEYYYQVRAYSTGSEYSVAASFGPTAARNTGTSLVYENDSALGSYYICATAETVTLADAADSDIALNNLGATPVLKSAHTATGGIKQTKLKFWGTAADAAAFDAVTDVDVTGGVYELEIEFQDVIILYTEGNDHYVKIWITSGAAGSPLAGAGDDEYLEFDYDYQVLADCTIF